MAKKAAPKTKTAPVKKSVKKSVKAVKKVVKKAAKPSAEGRGRPAGAKTVQTDTLLVTATQPLQRKNAVEPIEGLRRVSIMASVEKYGVALERLVAVIESNPDKLVAWLSKQK